MKVQLSSIRFRQQTHSKLIKENATLLRIKTASDWGGYFDSLFWGGAALSIVVHFVKLAGISGWEPLIPTIIGLVGLAFRRWDLIELDSATRSLSIFKRSNLRFGSISVATYPFSNIRIVRCTSETFSENLLPTGGSRVVGPITVRTVIIMNDETQVELGNDRFLHDNPLNVVLSALPTRHAARAVAVHAEVPFEDVGSPFLCAAFEQRERVTK